MTLSDISTALLTVTSNVYHYTALEQSDQYIVWAEDGQADALWADGKMQEQVITGTIDYFTKTENDANVASIQEALNSIDLSWSFSSLQYEDETGYLHYEWIFEVAAWLG